MARSLFGQVGFLAAFFVLAGKSLLGQPDSLTLSSGSTVPGGTIALDLSFTTPNNQPAGLQWTFVYSPTDILAITVASGAASTAAGKSISCAGQGGSYTCLATGINSRTIGNGVVAIATVTLSSRVISTSIGVTNSLGATLSGDAYATTGTGATITAGYPVTLSALTCNPASLLGPVSATCTITLSAAAPAGGAVIALSSNNVNLTAPPTIMVSIGSTTATFTATSAGVTADQNVTLTATYNGTSQSALLSLAAPTVVSSLQCNLSSLGSFASSNCTVTLSKPAPPGGAATSLSTTLSGLTVPSSVVVPAASTTSTFAVTAGFITFDQTGSLTASYNSSSQSVSLTVVASLL